MAVHTFPSAKKTAPVLNSAATELNTLFQDVCPQGLGLPALPAVTVPQAPSPIPDAPKSALIRSFGISLLRIGMGLGTIALTVTTGIVAGAIVAQRYPSLGAHLPLETEPPVLERIFRRTTAQSDRLTAWVKSWRQPASRSPQPLPAFSPEILAQWEPGSLSLEIDRLQREVENVEAQVLALESQLQMTSPHPSPLSDRLDQIDRALDSAGNPRSSAPAVHPLHMTLPTDALFEEGKAVLKPEAAELLRTLEETLGTGANHLSLTIATHTDDIGSESDNLELSFQRSQTLKSYLSARLQPSGGLSWNAVGYGETQPLVDNSTQSNRQRNRRVELITH